MIYLGLKNQ